jgi:hypothetical protein
VVSTGRALLEGLAVPERHTVTVSASGFQPRTIAVMPELEGHSETLVTLEREIAGAVTVESSPSGARLSVDGNGRGQTPTLVSGLVTGPHELRLELPGYVTLDTTIAVVPDMAPLQLSLAPQADGFLRIRGRPMALLFIDDTQIGSGPLPGENVPLRPGKHVVSARVGEQTFDITIDIGPEELLSVEWDSNGIRVVPK